VPNSNDVPGGDDNDEIKKAKVGETIDFGGREWLVLEKEEGRILIITKDIVCLEKYNEKDEAITWAGCSLREYLNGRFLTDSFNDTERARISDSKLENPDNEIHKTAGGVETDDKIFLLSIREAEDYFGKDNNAARIANYNGGAYSWWLRSPGCQSNTALIVFYNGNVDVYGNYVDSARGVRPALRLKL
jgi:hypothetical protein